MITLCVKLFYQGGLGNQLFQYSFGKYLQARGFAIEFQTSFLNVNKPTVTSREYELNTFNEPIFTSKKDLIKLTFLKNLPFNSNKVLIEKYPNQEIEKYITKNTKYLIGYFQSLHFVESIWASQAQTFTSLVKKPKYLPKKYTAIHLRFGDYKKIENRNIFGLFSPSYFSQILRQVSFEPDQKKLFVVTDSPIESKKFFEKVDIYNFDLEIKCSTTLEDFNILIHAQNNIISNSSFSWWSAYFGNKIFKNNIFAPKPWYVNGWETHKSFYPNDWQVFDRF
jgi:hypothetical protein